MTIRKFHKSNNQANRNVCLIPNSAHGTNPASAQMAGMSVVIVNSAENGDVDIEDFKEKAIKAGEVLSTDNITAKRPGTGISPMRWDEVIGRTAVRDFAADELIEL